MWDLKGIHSLDPSLGANRTTICDINQANAVSSCSELPSKHQEGKLPKPPRFIGAACCSYGAVSDTTEQRDLERFGDFLHCCF